MSAFDLFTERLRLKPFEAADRELLVQFYGDPAVMSVRKFGVLAPREAAAQLEEIVGHWSHHGFGMYAVRSITDERFLGECGLRWLEDGRDVEVSYGLWPNARGSGLATEASRRVLTHGFEDLGLEQIIARGRANNLPSRRVMDKLGMTLVFEQPRDDKPPLVEYSVTKKAWADAMARIKNNQENEP